MVVSLPEFFGSLNYSICDALVDFDRSRPVRDGLCFLSGEAEGRRWRGVVRMGRRLSAEPDAEYGVAGQGGADAAYRDGLSRVDGRWRRRYGCAGYRLPARTGHPAAPVFRHDAHRLRRGVEDGVTSGADKCSPRSQQVLRQNFLSLRQEKLS